MSRQDIMPAGQTAKVMAQSLKEQMSMSGDVALNSIGKIFKGAADKEIKIVLDPFVDTNTGEVPGFLESMANSIETVFKPEYDLLPLSPDNLAQSDYVLTGTLTFRTNPVTGERAYEIEAGIIGLAEGKGVARMRAWISVPSSGAAAGQSWTPVRLRNQYLHMQMEAAHSPLAPGGYKPYVAFLRFKAILMKAWQKYGQRNFQASYEIFKHLSQQSYADDPQVALGLYRVSLAMGKRQEALTQLEKMITLALDRGPVVLNLTFEPGSAFLLQSNKQQALEYALLLEAFAKVAQKSKQCFALATWPDQGEAKKANDLAKQRAAMAQKVIAFHYKGFINKSQILDKVPEMARGHGLYLNPVTCQEKPAPGKKK